MDWERFERILSRHDPYWKRKTILETKIKVAIDEIERNRLQQEFERMQKIRVYNEIQARKQKEQEERQRQASDTAIDILASQNEFGQIRLPSGRWVDSEKFFEAELDGKPMDLEEKIKDKFRSTLQELQNEGQLAGVENLFKK